jgi:hypothetical protein
VDSPEALAIWLETKETKVKKTSSAVKDFLDEDDVKSSDAMTRDNSNIIKFQKDEKSPIYFLRSQFIDGFAHWVTLPSGDSVRVPCIGGTEGNGRDPDNCPICKYVDSLYKQATQAKGQNAENLREQASKMRGSYEIYFIVAKGSLSVVKIRDDGKHTTSVDFDDPQVGIMRLTKAQYNTLRGIPTKYSYISSNKDLFNRYIMVDKQVRGDDGYASIEFIPAEKPTKKPDVDIPDELDISEYFDADIVEARKVLALHMSDSEEDEEDVDYENDDDDEEVIPKKKIIKNQKVQQKAKKAVVEDDVDDDTEL